MLQTEQVLHGRYQLKQKLGQPTPPPSIWGRKLWQHNAGRQTWLAVGGGTKEKGQRTEEKLSDNLVIVKLLALAAEADWDGLKLFEREAQILKQLNHPQIPLLY